MQQTIYTFSLARMQQVIILSPFLLHYLILLTAPLEQGRPFARIPEGRDINVVKILLMKQDLSILTALTYMLIEFGFIVQYPML
jgi:hypothetical protein